jgi:sulfide dehydrogenase cytochrome subunit
MKHTIPAGLGAAVAIFSFVAVSDVYSQTATPRVLANTCFSCHGTEGNSQGAMPTIAGKSPEYIVQSLRDFRSDKKRVTVMNRIAKGFTDDEIEALGRYFSEQ